MGHNLRAFIATKDDTKEELYNALSNINRLTSDTVQRLFDAEVNGFFFLSLTENKLEANFKNISFGQREELLRIVEMNRNNDQSLLCSPSPSIILPSDLSDLGANYLLGTVSESGDLEFISASDQLPQESSLSQSFSSLVKTKAAKVTKKSRSPTDDDIKPMEVDKILNKTQQGRDIIKKIKEEHYIDLPTQSAMLTLLFDQLKADNGSPAKFYPSTSMKIAMAKGIAHDFPELSDDGAGKVYDSWYCSKTCRGIVQTRLNTVRDKLPPEQRKRRRLPIGESSSKASKASGSSSSSASTSRPSTSSACCSSQSSSELSLLQSSGLAHEKKDQHDALLASTNALVPTSHSKSVISSVLAQTFDIRRKWILQEKPDCTQVIMRYKHLWTFGGDMILEEFNRIEPLCDSLIVKLGRLAPILGKVARILKSSVCEDLSRFDDDVAKAVVLLPKLIPITLTPNIVKDASVLSELKRNKDLLQGTPSSAILQIAPEGTDAATYVSVEISTSLISDEWKPVPPYLLWLSNDLQSGDLYLKLDRKTMFISSFREDMSTHPLLKALDVLFKCHFVFNCSYHSYLTYVFNYLESLYGIQSGVKDPPSIQKLKNAIREEVKRTSVAMH